MPLSPSEEPDIETRRKRLRYRAWHRGTRELDMILGPYAETHAATMSGADIDRLEALMQQEETDLLGWFMGQTVPPEDAPVDLIAEIAEFARNRDRND